MHQPTLAEPINQLAAINQLDGMGSTINDDWLMVNWLTYRGFSMKYSALIGYYNGKAPKRGIHLQKNKIALMNYYGCSNKYPGYTEFNWFSGILFWTKNVEPI